MHNGQIGGYERVRRRLGGMIDDDYYCASRRHHRQASSSSIMLFSEGLETDPVGALMRTIGKIERLARGAAVNEPFKFTSVLSDGNAIYAVRHSTDDVAPTMFHRQRGDHVMVMSEPFDEDEDCEAWREVPAGQMLVIEKARPAGHGAVRARHLNRRFLRITSQVTAITVLRPCERLHIAPRFRCLSIGQRIEAVAGAPHLPIHEFGGTGHVYF